MVVDLCLPQFQTTVHCNKLCADGYDVTNLVSKDPAIRRRGFKLEYFLRPPVQVTLKFGLQVDLCRVDVELWPWGMDQGQACKRLEISTCSGPREEPTGTEKNHKHEEHRSTDSRGGAAVRQRERNGHPWALQAKEWSEQTREERPQRGQAQGSRRCSRPDADSTRPEADFKLVGRCELREETRVCFTRPHFQPRPPFLTSPPPPPANCRQEELWSRGLLSLGSVTQLRVTLPFGGAASALGLKALAVWGQPARCCPPEDVEMFKRAHMASGRRPGSETIKQPACKPRPLPQSSSSSSVSIPDEFLDPITQEVMTLPMLLPSGVSVDQTTLEEHQKREATWARPPNDPFTGVPFTAASRPLPNPQLKSRIDRFLLQTGMKVRDGLLGREGEGKDPQPSRLVAQNTVSAPGASTNHHSKKLNLKEMPIDAAKRSSSSPKDEKQIEPQTKRHRVETTADFPNQSDLSRPPSSLSGHSSHEQRLSASLDEALLSALQGRPSFTSGSPQQRPATAEDKSSDASRQGHMTGAANSVSGEGKCSACSRPVSVYSTPGSPVYRLSCAHLLCRSCLRGVSQPKASVTLATPSHILCPTCHTPTARSGVTRVHH